MLLPVHSQQSWSDLCRVSPLWLHRNQTLQGPTYSESKPGSTWPCSPWVCAYNTPTAWGLGIQVFNTDIKYFKRHHVATPHHLFVFLSLSNPSHLGLCSSFHLSLIPSSAFLPSFPLFLFSLFLSLLLPSSLSRWLTGWPDPALLPLCPTCLAHSRWSMSMSPLGWCRWWQPAMQERALIIQDPSSVWPIARTWSCASWNCGSLDISWVLKNPPFIFFICLILK